METGEWEACEGVAERMSWLNKNQGGERDSSIVFPLDCSVVCGVCVYVFLVPVLIIGEENCQYLIWLYDLIWLSMVIVGKRVFGNDLLCLIMFISSIYLRHFSVELVLYNNLSLWRLNLCLNLLVAGPFLASSHSWKENIIQMFQTISLLVRVTAQ